MKAVITVIAARKRRAGDFVRHLRKFMLAVGLLSLAAPTTVGATTDPRPSAGRLLATGLQGSVGSAIGPDGALYVAEGALGQITRIDPKTGAKTLYADGLPESGVGIGSPMDVAFIGKTAYALVTLVGQQFGTGGINGIYRLKHNGKWELLADLGKFSVDNPAPCASDSPPTCQIDVPTGVQYALQPIRNGFLVTDGHHNRVLHVPLEGKPTELIRFENNVPTGLAVKGNTVYMAEGGPVPYKPEDGKVISFKLQAADPKATQRERASGFSLLVDVELDQGGKLFALSQGDERKDVPAPPPGDTATPNSGKLLRANKDGTFAVVVDKLNLPTSLELVEDTAFVVTLTGEVWRIDDVSKLARSRPDRDEDRHEVDRH